VKRARVEYLLILFASLAVSVFFIWGLFTLIQGYGRCN
jgi:hypothetical protein